MACRAKPRLYILEYRLTAVLGEHRLSVDGLVTLTSRVAKNLPSPVMSQSIDSRETPRSDEIAPVRNRNGFEYHLLSLKALFIFKGQKDTLLHASLISRRGKKCIPLREYV